MNTPTAIAFACLGLGVTSAASYLLLREAPETNGPERALDGEDAARASALRDLESRSEALEQRLAALEGRAATPVRLDQGAIEAAVRRALEAQGALLAAAAPASEAEATEAAARKSVGDIVTELLAADEDEHALIWKALAEEGRADEVLAALVERAKADPNDPERQLELAQAYLARISEVGNSPLAGTYATAADRAFDRALEVDPNHWEARFYKAVSLSFWPPVLGKQAAAIQEFETLVAQQSKLVPAAHHAESHLLLGNLYQQIGQHEKALAAWRLGAELFPSHAGLAQQIALASQRD